MKNRWNVFPVKYEITAAAARFKECENENEIDLFNFLRGWKSTYLNQSSSKR